MSLVILLAAGTASGQTALSRYVTAQNFALGQTENAIEGTLELSLDGRLSRSVRDELWGKGDWSFVLSPDSSLYREFSKRPPAKARLSIADATGKVVAVRDLQTALAKLQRWGTATGGNRLFLLTQDYSAGFGSYSGLGTTLLMVSGPAFRDVKALNEQSHQEEEIRLTKSLKADWRITQQGEHTEILSVSCHPASLSRFVVDYVRYSTDGERWLVFKREADGVWESGDPFPKRSMYP
jgi:hypothetical protein